MPTNVGTLRAELTVETAKFRRDMNTATRTLNSNVAKMNRGVDKLKRGFDLVGRGLVAALGGAALAKIGGDFVKFADTVDHISQRLGISTEALSQLRHAAELSGVPFNTLTAALQRMGRRVSEAAAGAGEAKKALEELGIDAQKVTKLPLDRQLERIADALAAVEGQSNRSRLAMRIFDTEGVALLQMTTRGAAGIREMRMEAHQLGLTLDDDAIRSTRAFQESLTRLRAAFRGFRREAGVPFLQFLTPIVEYISNTAIPAFRKFASRITNVFRLSFLAPLKGVQKALEAIAGAPLFDGMTERAKSALFVVDSVVQSLEEQLATSFDFAGRQLGQFDDTVEGVDGTLKKLTGTAKGTATALKQIEFEGFKTPMSRDLEAENLAAFQTFIQSLRQEERQLGKTRRELELMNFDLEALDDNLVNQARVLIENIEAWEEAQQAAGGYSEELEAVKQAVQGFGDRMTDAFVEMTETGKASFRDMVDSIIADISRIAFRKLIADPLVKSITSVIDNVGTGSGGSGGLFGLFEGLLGFRQGGQFKVGGGSDSQLVAFRATPGETVTVTPPGMAAAGAGTTVNLHVDMTSLDPQDAARVLLANEGVITTVMQRAFHRAGRAGPLG